MIFTATERRSLQRRSTDRLTAERDALIREATIHALLISASSVGTRVPIRLIATGGSSRERRDRGARPSVAS